MLQFKTLTLRNFLSFGNDYQKFEFKNGLWLIIGKNNDVLDSCNGVGKSTNLNAIIYCLFDRTRNGIKLDNLRNKYNSKFPMSVSLDFDLSGIRSE